VSMAIKNSPENRSEPMKQDDGVFPTRAPRETHTRDLVASGQNGFGLDLRLRILPLSCSAWFKTRVTSVWKHGKRTANS
jgi:hypothetical protein